MNIFSLIVTGLLSLNLILGQLLKNSYSRSVANMDELLKLEEELVLNLEQYTAELIKKHETILSGISMMKELHHLQEEAGPTKFWENPLISFSLIRHMQSDWHMWQAYMEKPVGLEYLAYLGHIKPRLPQFHDFYDAAEGLRRIQWAYYLSAQDISQGLLAGVQYNSSLTALDCFALAEHLINGSRWSFAQQWLQAAAFTLERSNPQPAMEMLRGITPALLYRTAAKTDEEEGKALVAYQIALGYSPQDAKLWQQFYSFEQRSLTLPGSHSLKPEEMDAYEHSKLPFCCTGRCEVPSKLQLFCLWNNESHPFLRLAPIKTEILSIDPHVVLFHDIVSEAERNFLRSISKKKLKPSLTVNVVADIHETGQFRTSKSVWYESNITKATERLSVLLEDATGLDMSYSEPFQVINYGIGGLFETHLDCLLPNENRYNGTADRMATALFYLSEVAQGGATVFPFLNITVFPQPGAALFWYNTNPGGDEEFRTMHAGCPVIVGSKWVTSKWINDLGQELRVPCLSSNN